MYFSLYGLIYLNIFSHETRYRIVILFELSVLQRIFTAPPLLFYFKWKAVTKYPKNTKGLSTLNSFRFHIKKKAILLKSTSWAGQPQNTFGTGFWLSVHF